MSVCGMMHTAQESNDPLPQLRPLQPQEEFIQVDLPQAQGFCERDLGPPVKRVTLALLVPRMRKTAALDPAGHSQEGRQPVLQLQYN